MSEKEEEGNKKCNTLRNETNETSAHAAILKATPVWL